MNTQPPAAVAMPISGTALEVAIRRLLSSLSYPPCNVSAALAWVSERGSALGIPAEVIDPDDLAAVHALVAPYRAHLEERGLLAADAPDVDPWDVEADPRDWPDDTDADRWVPNDPALPVDAPAETSADTNPASGWPEWADAFEPSPEERLGWTIARDAEERLGLLTAPAGPAPVRGGSPDERPVKVRAARNRPVAGWTDEDQVRTHGRV